MQLEKVSASQISLYEQCPRKWYYRYVMKLPTPSSPAQQLGTEIHSELEEFVNSHCTQSVKAVALPAAELLPKYNESWITEHEFFIPTVDAIRLHGFVDLLCPNIGWIIDYKTSSSFNYAKSPEELAVDTQMMIYAYMSYSQGFIPYDKSVTVAHMYVKTKGSPDARLVYKTVDYPHVLNVWEQKMDVVRSMVKTAELTSVNEAAPNILACSAYGGCFFRSQCVVPIGGVKGLFDKAAKMGSLTDKLKAQQQQKQLEQRMESVEVAVSLVEKTVVGMSDTQSAKPMVELPVGVLSPDAPPRFDNDSDTLPPALGDDAGLPDEATTVAKAEASAEPQAAPKRRGRPPKARTESTGAPQAVANASDITAVRPTGQKGSTIDCTGPGSPEDYKTVSTTGFNLYVDCYPVKGVGKTEPVLFETWAADFFDTLSHDSGLADFRLVDFGKWKGPFAVLLKDNIGRVPKSLVVSSYAVGAHEALEVLIPYADNVVRALKG